MTDSQVTQVLCSGLDNCTIVRGNTIRRILVPFDNSSYAARSFGTALDMAKNRGASLLQATDLAHPFMDKDILLHNRRMRAVKAFLLNHE